MQPRVPGLRCSPSSDAGGHHGECAGCEGGGSWHPEVRQGRIDRGVRGAITPAAIQEIKKMGYASIINLRLATEQGADIDANTAAAKVAGIPYYHIPFSTAAPDPAVVDTFLKTITAPGVQPASIH